MEILLAGFVAAGGTISTKGHSCVDLALYGKDTTKLFGKRKCLVPQTIQFDSQLFQLLYVL